MTPLNGVRTAFPGLEVQIFVNRPVVEDSARLLRWRERRADQVFVILRKMASQVSRSLRLPFAWPVPLLSGTGHQGRSGQPKTIADHGARRAPERSAPRINRRWIGSCPLPWCSKPGLTPSSPALAGLFRLPRRAIRRSEYRSMERFFPASFSVPSGPPIRLSVRAGSRRRA